MNVIDYIHTSDDPCLMSLNEMISDGVTYHSITNAKRAEAR